MADSAAQRVHDASIELGATCNHVATDANDPYANPREGTMKSVDCYWTQPHYRG